MNSELAKYEANVAVSDLASPWEENDHKHEVQQVEEHCPQEVPAVKHLDRPLVVAFVFKLMVCHLAFKH